MRFCSLSFILLLGFSRLALADGDLFFSVYIDGKPTPGVTATVDGSERLVTDNSGFSYVELSNGEHKLEVTVNERIETVPFEIVEDEETHLIINRFSDEMDVSLIKPEAITAKKDIKAENLGVVEGVVANFSNGQPVSGVKVFVKGHSEFAITDSKGHYKLYLPKGKHTLSMTHKNYSTEIVPDIEVGAQQSKELRTKITPSGLQLEDFVVIAPRMAGSIEALIEVRKSSNQVADVMGQEQMAKTGDSDAAGSLKRVTGLSLVDDKYVYVRGMGERYSNTLLNGVAIPSPDPSRRVVPLDLFPAGVLESMVVQKSFSPNMPGEFGGGTVSLQTNSLPDEFFVKASVSQNVRQGAEGLEYQGGETDWLGIDDGTRDLPPGLTIDQPAFGDQLQNFNNNHNTSAINENQSMPNFSFAIGNRHKLTKRWKVGYLFSALYGDKRNVTQEARFDTIVDEGQVRAISPRERLRSNRDIKLGGIAGFGVKYSRSHEVNLSNILVRKTEDKVYVTEDFNHNQTEDERRTILEWTETQLRSTILQGEHKIKTFVPFKLKWSGALSQANLNQPDRREYAYEIDQTTGVEVFSPLQGIPDGYERRYTQLVENAADYSVSVNVPFTVWNNLSSEIEIGAQTFEKDRESKMQRYNLEKTGDYESLNIKPDASPETIIGQCLGQCLQYENAASRTDNYEAGQELSASYIRTKIPFHRTLSLDTGLRYESSTQNVTSVAPFDPDADPVVSQLRTTDVLPSSTLTWRFTDEMQIRAAYSETISRPDFRELSSTFWIDNERGTDVTGNPALQSAVIKNYDLRWEWYFTRKENISFGLFYKEFENPIEEVFISGSDPLITFINVPEAENYGLEVEYRKNLGFISMPQFSISGNYTLIESNVVLGELAQSNLTSSERPLQGQSPYMVNILLDYEDEKRDIESTLVYNFYGRRITTLGTFQQPDEYQMPYQQLDYLISKGFDNGLRLRFKVSNILDQPLTYQRGIATTRERRKGRTFGLSLSMRL